MVGAEGATVGIVTVMVPLVTVRAVWVLPFESAIEKVDAFAIKTVAGEPRVAFAVAVSVQVTLSVWSIAVSAAPLTVKSRPAAVESVEQSIGSFDVKV